MKTVDLWLEAQCLPRNLVAFGAAIERRLLKSLFVLMCSSPLWALAQGEPTAAARNAFLRDPSAQTAQSLIDTCDVIPRSGSVYDRYDAAVARQKCLEAQKQLMLTVADTRAPEARGIVAGVQSTDRQTEETKEVKKELWAEKSFIGINWGVGVGYAFGRGPDRITEAEIVNGLVRVKSDSTDRARIVLEAHHFFDGKGDRFGWGPFASVQGGTGDAAVAFGLGLAFGWRDADPKSPGGFVLGIGYEWNDGVKVLGDGIVANQPLPTGETQVRFKDRSAGAVLVFFSRRFAMSGPPQS